MSPYSFFSSLQILDTGVIRWTWIVPYMFYCSNEKVEICSHYISDSYDYCESFLFLLSYRTVSVEEAEAYCESQDSSCAFVETSAKKNFRVDETFYQLFLMANLPSEMAPNHHKRISANFGAPCPLPPSTPSHHSKKYHLSVKRRLSDACGVVTPNVRRPSIRTDLMIMRTKTCTVGDSPSNSTNSPIRWRRVDNACVVQ